MPKKKKAEPQPDRRSIQAELGEKGVILKWSPDGFYMTCIGLNPIEVIGAGAATVKEGFLQLDARRSTESEVDK